MQERPRFGSQALKFWTVQAVCVFGHKDHGRTHASSYRLQRTLLPRGTLVMYVELRKQPLERRMSYEASLQSLQLPQQSSDRQS